MDNSLHVPSDCSQLSSEELCTPPRQPTLEERLLETTGTDLEVLLERVLEKRPELRDKFSSMPVKNVRAHIEQVKVTWDENLIDDRDMYRDDRGGWVKASDVASCKYKVVGTDFRGLPIVHIGRGRPKTTIIELLKIDPHSQQQESSVDITENSSSEPVHREPAWNELNPRVSKRLHKKRLVQAQNQNKRDDDYGLCDTETDDGSSVEKRRCGDTTSHITEEPSVYVSLERSEVPSDVIAEESVVEYDSCDSSNMMSHNVTMSHTDKSDMVISSQNDVQKKGRFNCEDCDQSFRSLGKYRLHLGDPDCRGFAVRCYMCQQKFTDPSMLQSHEILDCCLQTPSTTFTGNTDDWSERRYICSLCGQGSRTESDIIEHAKLYHPSERIFRCRLCEKAYDELRPLCNHFTNTHTQREYFDCDTCGKQLVSQKALGGHMKIAHTAERKLLKCPLCEKLLRSKKSMEHHINTFHENNKPHKCEYCDKSFATKSGLDVHVKAHQDIRDFVCGVCGAAFIQKVRLIEHSRTHGGVKTFMCASCPRAFYTKHALQTHERTHTRAKPYICELCGKTFAHTQSLKKHTLTHSASQELIKCQFCENTFRSAGAVYRHCRVQHTDKLHASCLICQLQFVSDADLNRHNRYRHMAKFDGRAEQKTFLSSASELAQFPEPMSSKQDSQMRTDIITEESTQTNSQPITERYQCVCGELYDDFTSLSSHLRLQHSDTVLINNPSNNTVLPSSDHGLQSASTGSTSAVSLISNLGAGSSMCTVLMNDIPADTQEKPVLSNTVLADDLHVVTEENCSDTPLHTPLHKVEKEKATSGSDFTSSGLVAENEHGADEQQSAIVDGLDNTSEIRSAVKEQSVARTSKVYKFSTAATGLTELHQLFGNTTNISP